MPRPMGKGGNEKPKNLRKSLARLFKELKIFRVLIIISLSFAILSSILAIASPDKLSNLIDKISEGLVVNTDNISKIATSVEDNMKNVDYNNLMSNEDIPDQDKMILMELFTYDEKEKMFDSFNKLSTTTINLIFKEITINDIKISGEDQLNFLNIMSKYDENNQSGIYESFDNMPDSIAKLIEPKMNLDEIKKIAILLFGIYFASAIFTYIQAITMTNVSNKFAHNLRGRISHKINRLPLKYFDKNQTGDLLSRVTNDVDMIAQSMNESIDNLVSSFTLFVGTIIMMFVTNYMMAITAIVSSLIGFIFMAIILSKSQKYFNARQKYLGDINGHIEEVYSGLKIVKTYNAKEEVNEKFNTLNEKVYETSRKSQFLSGLMGPMMGFIGNIGYVAVCIVGAILVMNGKITFGVIIAFITYVRLFTSPLSQMGQAMTSVQSAAAASERVFEFLDEKEMDNEENKTKYLARKDVLGNIEFKNVEFTYEGNDKPTIHNFNAQINAGQKIAIVGPTGAGKTTIVNLLMRFYEINKGNIYIDGISAEELTRSNIHDLFTMVLQDTWLFEGTIKENIVYNRKNVSSNRVEEVCKIVGLDHFIKTLSNGYNTIIKDNDSISAGQRQLLTIARGMIEDAPFLILDEATSNVDTRTEELVQKAMDKLTKDKTSFIIAHRLSTIKNADLILVMKNGNIIEQGKHEELLSKNGFYAELYNSQFEL